MEGTKYLIHPVGDIRVYDDLSKVYGSSKTNQVSYAISNYNRFEITGYFDNLKFQHIDSTSVVALTDKKIQIQTATYLSGIAEKYKKQILASLNNIANKLDSNFDLACNAILACKGKVITIGLGKSGHVAVKSAATLSSTGTPSVFLHAAEALHGDVGLIRKLDLVICYSNSGETKELLLL